MYGVSHSAPDPRGQHCQQCPAEKAQIQTEQIALAPVQERLGALDGLGRRDGRFSAMMYVAIE